MKIKLFLSFWLLGLMIFISCLGYSQTNHKKFGEYKKEKKEISFSEFFNSIDKQNKDSLKESIVFRNIKVKLTFPDDCQFGNCNSGDIEITYMPQFNRISKLDSSKRYLFTKPVLFENCDIEDFGLRFFNCEFQKEVSILHCNIPWHVEFDSTYLEGFQVDEDCNFDWLIIKKSIVKNSLWIRNSNIEYLSIENNQFIERDDESKWYYRNIRKPTLLIYTSEINYCSIGSNNFPLNSPKGVWSPTIALGEGKFNHLKISETTCEGIEISYTEVSISTNIQFMNITKGLLMNSAGLPEFKTRIDWDQIDNGRLLTERFHKVHNKDSSFVYSSKGAFKDLMANYSILYNLYKARSDLASANACYSEMKLLEAKGMEAWYKKNPSFEWYFRWKLSEFLNYFADYGTNPAKAVVKSLWVILIFAVFYLFFPSDWDVTNRVEFLKRWKELLRGRTKEQRQKSPFSFFLSSLFFRIYTGFIHLLNALTLSLNAFTTLGFGDIPTHGAARYVTIVQGFIGWFLLTIFSVSLINQVLG